MKSTEFVHCPPCDKRLYADARTADKALGRTNTKAATRNSAGGNRTGMNRKRGRVYPCPHNDGLHITSMSRAEFERRTVRDGLLNLPGVSDALLAAA